MSWDDELKDGLKQVALAHMDAFQVSFVTFSPPSFAAFSRRLDFRSTLTSSLRLHLRRTGSTGRKSPCRSPLDYGS